MNEAEKPVCLIIGAGKGVGQAIAQACHWLHQQPRSTWTHELDLRPWREQW